MEEGQNWAMKMELPAFTGSNPIVWISKAERFFEIQEIHSLHKLQYAFMSMEGAAMRWFYIWSQKSPDLEWESFSTALIQRFGDHYGDHSFERWRILKQEEQNDWETIEEMENSAAVFKERTSNESQHMVKTQEIKQELEGPLKQEFGRETAELQGLQQHSCKASNFVPAKRNGRGVLKEKTPSTNDANIIIATPISPSADKAQVPSKKTQDSKKQQSFKKEWLEMQEKLQQMRLEDENDIQNVHVSTGDESRVEEKKPTPSSPTMNQGNTAKWRKQEGDMIEVGDILCEIETANATLEFETLAEGYLAKILTQEGSKEVAVGHPIAITVEDASDIEAIKNSVSSSSTNQQKLPQCDTKNKGLASMADSLAMELRQKECTEPVMLIKVIGNPPLTLPPPKPPDLSLHAGAVGHSQLSYKGCSCLPAIRENLRKFQCEIPVFRFQP